MFTTPIGAASYLSIKDTERLAGVGIEPSVGSVGDIYRNTLADKINALFKVEVIPSRPMSQLQGRGIR